MKAIHFLQKFTTNALLVLAIPLLLLLCGCENNPEEVNDLSRKKTGVEEAKDVRINYTTGGKTKGVLTAPLMYRVQDTLPYIEFPKTVHVDFYKDSVIESKLDARYAKYIETQSKVFLKDSVRVINTKGDTLYCEELWWDRNRTNNEFYTTKPVKIRTRTHLIDGTGMESKQDFTNWHITGSKGKIKLRSAEFPQ
jgi:LPS export ABC transporter protein LptC